MGKGSLRGDLIRWAREQRGLSMREVQARGGPTASFQSEVERGKKSNVGRKKLETWLQILQVDEAFVRSDYQPYHSDPQLMRRLAADIVDDVYALQATREWQRMGTAERHRQALHLLLRSRNLTLPSLAYVLGLDMEALEQMLTGQLPIPVAQVGAIAELILPDQADLLLQVSDRHLLGQYGPVMRLAYEKGVSAEDLMRLLDELR